MKTFHRKLMQTRHRRTLNQNSECFSNTRAHGCLYFTPINFFFIDSLMYMMINSCKHFSVNYMKAAGHGMVKINSYACSYLDKAAAKRRGT